MDGAYARILILLLGIDNLWNRIYELLKKRKNDFIKTISISKFSLFIWIKILNMRQIIYIWWYRIVESKKDNFDIFFIYLYIFSKNIDIRYF